MNLGHGRANRLIVKNPTKSVYALMVRWFFAKGSILHYEVMMQSGHHPHPLHHHPTRFATSPPSPPPLPTITTIHYTHHPRPLRHPHALLEAHCSSSASVHCSLIAANEVCLTPYLAQGNCAIGNPFSRWFELPSSLTLRGAATVEFGRVLL